jgi:hypothetical protein
MENTVTNPSDGTISVYNQKSKKKSKLFIFMVKQQYWKECCTIPCPSKYFNASNGLYVLLLILTLIKLKWLIWKSLQL